MQQQDAADARLEQVQNIIILQVQACLSLCLYPGDWIDGDELDEMGGWTERRGEEERRGERKGGGDELGGDREGEGGFRC